ncbi:MAG: hypothetical protein ACLTX3_08830 [Lachnospiraceae bacterium]
MGTYPSKEQGGSNRVKNALLSCSSCNRDKDNQTPEEWIGQVSFRLSHEKGKKRELDSKRIELIQKVIDGKPEGQPMRYVKRGCLPPGGIWKTICSRSSGMWNAPVAAGQNITVQNWDIPRSIIMMPSVSGQSRKRAIMTERTGTTCMPKPQAVVPGSVVH